MPFRIVVAKRKTIFDDKPVEISVCASRFLQYQARNFLWLIFFTLPFGLRLNPQELTFIIKQDIAKLNKQIAQLQDYVRSTKGPSKQASEHSSNVVVLLQSKLASTSMSFKDVLEIRTQVCLFLF